MAVRVCAAESVMALLRHRRSAALDLAAQLFADAPADIHGARSCHELLTYVMLSDAERFAPELVRVLAGPESAAHYAGASWSVLVMQDKLPAGLPADVQRLPPAARHGAAKMAASDVAYGAPLLKRLFHDREKSVRQAASRAMRKVDSLPRHEADDLITAFLTSPAFSEHLRELAHALAKTPHRLPSRTVHACQAIARAAEDQAAAGKRGYALLQRYLIEIVLRLYRQGGATTRAQCLDIIDSLYRGGAHGLRDALAGAR
ncbi:hypothetical protein [Streptomyces sp. NPDC059649]|uniref:hypothetical protein n=1 Tax=Streptomyces sp. NPDC059649 TaxID=3346895 RepID=UPI0036C7F018